MRNFLLACNAATPSLNCGGERAVCGTGCKPFFLRRCSGAHAGCAVCKVPPRCACFKKCLACDARVEILQKEAGSRRYVILGKRHFWNFVRRSRCAVWGCGAVHNQFATLHPP